MIISSQFTTLMAPDKSRADAALSKSLSRLGSSRNDIRSAGDSARPAMAAALRAQIQKTDDAQNRVGDAISYTQTQDGYLGKIAEALNQMSDLAVRAQDAAASDADRARYQSEFSQLSDFIHSVAAKDFNGVSLFSQNALEVTLDAEGTTLTMAGVPLPGSLLDDTLPSGLNSLAEARNALVRADLSLTELSQHRSSIDACQARLNAAADQLAVSRENLMAAASRIPDVAVAGQSTQYARQNILVQSGTAIIAQANATPQDALRLLP
jgi:flagellin